MKPIFTLLIRRIIPITSLSSTLAVYSVLLLLLLHFSACNDSESTDKSKNQSAPLNTILLPAPSYISDADNAKLLRACQLWFDTVLKSSVFNGGIVVAKKGNIIFEQYRGTNPLGSKDTIDALTAFHIASVSKTFTAMAILKLFEEGKLNLDDEYSSYFPAFNYPGVTIKSLLSHRSGLPNYLYFMEDLGWDEKIAAKNEDILEQLITRKSVLKDISAPDKHFTYCNTNYVLLALLIEKISGVPYPQFIKQIFFDPLQMTHSFVYTPAESAKASLNYDGRGKAIANNYLDLIYGDKNVYATPRDLLIWDRALSTNMLFKQETLDVAYQPYSNERPGIKNYGLGWRMNIYPNGKKVIFHNGWWHGNNAAFIRLLDEDATIIVVGNRFTYSVYKAYKLINSFNNYFGVLEEVEE